MKKLAEKILDALPKRLRSKESVVVPVVVTGRDLRVLEEFLKPHGKRKSI
jgi:hypothetical protein